MTWLRKLDAWCAKHLFHPPTIAVCWVLKCTQYRLSRDLWVLWIIGMLYFSLKQGEWLTAGVAVLVGVFIVSRNLRMGDDEEDGYPVMRFIWWLFLIVDVLYPTIDSWLTLLPLWAEYALTLRNLPPRQTKTKALKTKTQKV